jgi:SAM-dependent methyltransferase
MRHPSGGSARLEGGLWSSRARDFLVQEPKVLALYESALEELPIRTGTRLLDVGCGAGLFMRLAAQRGADVSGIDANEAFVDIARNRVPSADVVVGDIHALPYDDDCFDVVTGFEAFQLSSDPRRALREARRVASPGAQVVIATWGRPEQCEAANYVAALGGLLASAPASALGPFALSDPAAIVAFAADGGLTPGAHHVVSCVWNYAGEDELLTALRSTGLAVDAIQAVGGKRVTAAILSSLAPFRLSSGEYRLENVFSYLVSTTPAVIPRSSQTPRSVH